MQSLLRSLLALAAFELASAFPTIPQSLTSTATPQAATNLCGDESNLILSSTPWIVYNMVYNADQMVGTQCTYYNQTITPPGGNQEVIWSSTAQIEYVESTSVNP